MTTTLTAPTTTTAAEGQALPALTSVDARTLTRWGFAVDREGIAAHEDEAQYLVKTASALGVRPVLVQVLADTQEPAAARTRAFGKLALAISA